MSYLRNEHTHKRDWTSMILSDEIICHCSAHNWYAPLSSGEIHWTRWKKRWYHRNLFDYVTLIGNLIIKSRWRCESTQLCETKYKKLPVANILKPRNLSLFVGRCHLSLVSLIYLLQYFPFEFLFSLNLAESSRFGTIQMHWTQQSNLKYTLRSEWLRRTQIVRNAGGRRRHCVLFADNIGIIGQ